MTSGSRLTQMPVPRLIATLALAGSAAALLAWLLALGAHVLFDASRPTMSSLGWAVLRGIVFALILGLGLRLWRTRVSR